MVSLCQDMETENRKYLPCVDDCLACQYVIRFGVGKILPPQKKIWHSFAGSDLYFGRPVGIDCPSVAVMTGSRPFF